MQAYETPEILELGRVEELTLGCSCSKSCDCDGKTKEGSDDPPPPLMAR